MTNDKLKNEIIHHFKEWIRTYSMIHLAKVVVLCMMFMKKEGFPFKEYVKNYEKLRTSKRK